MRRRILPIALAAGVAVSALPAQQSAGAASTDSARVDASSSGPAETLGNGCRRVYPGNSPSSGAYAPVRICVSGTSFLVTGWVYDRKSDKRRACASLKYERKSHAGWKKQTVYIGCANGKGKRKKIHWDHASARKPMVAACTANMNGRSCTRYL
ncbi:hypothetical protein SMC26_08585 [Actinomadura fulvescens]|uniref:Secreted protein n=1 Tax=Actinomadura fulvescens TaxID=46160 RepID=A0ABN3QUP0_9ACTN